MSFILDALKKSELERQRQAIPGLVESGVARPRQRLPLWAIALCVLLGINLIVLTVVLTRGWLAAPVAGGATPQRSASHPADASATSNPAQASGDQRHFSPLDGAADSAAVYAPEVPVGADAPPVTTPPVPQTPMPTARQPATAASVVHPVRRRDPLLNDGDYKADDEEVLPSISELNLTGAQALPELHLDVHVFATNRAERFVFINMRKYHEGATLQEGPTLERIRRDGVILDYQGLRFLLPRQ
jgi:general secretion pathway protein B